MPRRRPIDHAALDDLIRLRGSVLTHAELVEMGVPLSTTCSRIGHRGPWQRLHPGVVLCHTGVPTSREQLLGALAYAGEGAQLTGLAALRLYSVKAVRGFQDIHVLVPHERRRQGRKGLIVERTRNLPTPRERAGLLVAPPARAVIDASRALIRLDEVREAVAEVVQTGLCPVCDIELALREAANQRSGLPRLAVAEVSAGVRSTAEAKVRDVFGRHGIPQPLWNWSLHTVDGEHVVTPDGWWEDIGAALQIDSMAYHLSPAAYKRTQRLERALAIHDVPFLPVAPGDVFTDEAAFVAQVRAFLARYADHVPTPDLVARPPGDRAYRRPA